MNTTFSRSRRALAAFVSLSLAFGPALAGDLVYQIPMNAPDMSSATAGSLKATPASHGFGTLVLGSAAATSTTLTNSGQDSLHITGVSIAGPYGQSNDCPAVLVGGASCQVSLVFTPTAAGSFPAPLEVTTTELGNVSPYAVSGAAVEPTTTLSMSLNSVSFGASNVGVPADVKTLTITNTGNSPATVNGVSVTDGASDFSQANDCGGTLSPGGSCTVNLGFTATTYGARSGNLNVYEQASGTLYSAALTGFGNAAVLGVSQTMLPMADTIVGFSSTDKVTVSNTGNLPVEGLSLFASGAGAELSIANTQCGSTLAAGASCDVTVSFAPSTPGNKTATLAINSSNAGAQSVAVSGKAFAQNPVLTPTASSLTFDATEVGSTTVDQSITLQNTGNIAVAVSGLGVVVGGTHFAQTNNCATVAVGASCTVSVRFAPQQRGNLSGTVYLKYDTQELTLGLAGQGLQGIGTLTPTDTDFGGVQVGQAATARTVTVTNTGDAPLSISSATIPVSDFAATSSCSTLAIGATCTVSVAFTPSSLGARTQTLTLGTNAGNFTSTVRGTGIKGYATVNPSTVTFAAQQVASTSGAQVVTVTNTGTSPLVFTGVSVITGAGEFAQSNNCATVAVNSSCVVNVNFTPSASGARTGTLAMTHNGDGLSTVALNGTGQVASASLSIGSFSSTHVGASSDTTAVLSNTGIGALSVTAPSAASVSGTDFSFVSSTCASSVAVGASCNIVVRFSPTSTAARTGSVALTTAAGVKSQPLSATGVQGTSSLSAASLTFAAQQVASTSAAQTVTVTNTGTSPLVFTGISVISGATDFAQSNGCATVAVNGTCTLNVTFTPSTTGSRTGTIALTHDGAGLSTITLAGTGQAQSATLSTPTFASTPVGSSNTATATLTNTGIGALSVTVPAAGSVTGTDFSFVSTTCASSVATGNNCTVTVRFSPSSTAARSGNLTVATGAGSQAVSLGSTGIQGYATVSPSSLTFTTRQNGTTSAAQTVTVTNTGTNTLTFTGVGISTGGTDFAQSNSCGSVAVNSSCTVNVTFTPAAAGARTGTLSFTHNGGGIANVSLSGTGQAASATITSGSWGSQQVGTTNASGYQVITNTGLGPISLTGTPTVNAPFTYLNNGCGSSLAAGAQCSVYLSFSPTAAQSYTQTLSVPTTAGTLTSTSTGTGVSASLVATSGSSAGTSLPPLTTSGTYLNYQNNGIGPVTLTANPTSSGSVTVYTQATSGWCYNGLVMAAGASCQVYGYFNAVAGSYSGTISLASNAPTVNQSVTGTVVGTLSVAGAAFGAVTVGATKDMTVAVTNSASVTARTMTYAATAPFSIVTNGCAATLAANTSCNLTVRYSPTAQTATSGNYVTVTGKFDRTVAGSADSANPGSVVTSYGAMSGNGTYAALVFSPTSLSFGSVQVGQSSTRAVTITNPGNIAATGLGGNVPAGYTVASVSPNPCGTSLAAGATCNLNVTFTPTAAQAYSGAFTVPGTNIVTASLPVSGTGTNPLLVLSGWYQGGNATMGVVGYNSDSGRWPTYTNTGSGPVVITGHTSTSAFWAWQGSGAPYCSIGYVVPAGGSCTFFNGVSSAAVGDYSGSSTVSYTGQGGSATFTTGVPNYTASIRTTTANVGSVAFGTRAQNQWNGPSTVTITNNASGNPLQNIAISFSGGNAGSFTTSGNTCGSTLAGGASCNIQVYFNPTWSANGFSSTLVVTGGYPRMQPGDSGYIPSNSSVNINIPVSGNGAYSQATLTSTAAQGFGGGWYGQGYNYLNWTYRNDGNVAMTLTSPSLGAPLGVSSNNCSNIAAGASCTIQVVNYWNNDVAATSQSFTPSGATIAPASANAAYTVYSAVPTWGATSLAFGNVEVGSSASRNITLYNYGANTAYNWAANSGIANLPAGFSFNTSACSNVANGSGGNAQGGSCNVVVTFSPTAAQGYGGGSVHLAAASRLNNTLTLSGTGSSPAGFGPSTAPAPATFTFTAGGSAATISSVTLGASSTARVTFAISANSCSGTIGAGGSCSVSVTSGRSGVACTTGYATVTILLSDGRSFQVQASGTNRTAC